MKKFVWGLVLAALGLTSLIGANGQNSGAQGLSVIMLIGGGVLAYLGWQALQQYKQTTALALQMIRENGKLSAGELAQRMGESEVVIRGHIAEAQRKGIVPFKTEIV